MTYIEEILMTEQRKLIKKIVSIYGKKGNFTEVEILNRFLHNPKINIVNDNFIKTSGRGRPKKNTKPNKN